MVGPYPLPPCREPELLGLPVEESPSETRRRWARQRRKYNLAYMKNKMAMMVPEHVRAGV
jgi:hypothetical protein